MISRIYNQIICPGTLGNKAWEKAYLGRYNLIVPAVIIIGLSAIPVCMGLWRLWHSDPNFDGLLLVPFMCAFIFCKSGEDFASCTPRPTKRALYVLPAVLGIMFVTSNYGFSRIAGLFLVASLLIASFGVLGYSNYRLFVGPLLFLALMVPLPPSAVDVITVNLQKLFSSVMEIVFLYFSNRFLGRYGFEFWFSGMGYPMIIAPECSGIRSLLGFVIMSSFFAVFDRHSVTTAILMISAGVATAMALNFLRILATVQMRISGLEEYSVGFWHGLLGIAVFMVGCLILSRLSRILKSLTSKIT